MAFVKNITDIKNRIPVYETFPIASYQPDVTMVENKYIYPILGKVQFDALAAEVAASTVNATLQKLLDKVLDAVVPMAFVSYAPKANINITSEGFQVANNAEGMQPASQARTRAFVKSNTDAAAYALEALLVFLDDNENDYPDWKNSSAEDESHSLFINKASEFSDAYGKAINRFTFLQVVSVMKKVERDQILPIISKSYFDELKTQIKGESLTDDNKLALSYIQEAVANFTMEKSLIGQMVKFTDEGIMMNAFLGISEGEAKQNPADDNKVDHMIREANKNGTFALRKLITFMNDNITDFPTYEAGGTYSTESPVFTNADDSKIYFAG